MQYGRKLNSKKKVADVKFNERTITFSTFLQYIHHVFPAYVKPKQCLLWIRDKLRLILTATYRTRLSLLLGLGPMLCLRKTVKASEAHPDAGGRVLETPSSIPKDTSNVTTILESLGSPDFPHLFLHLVKHMTPPSSKNNYLQHYRD